MHTSRCFPPSASMRTVLLPRRGAAQMRFASGAGVSTGLAMEPRPNALVVTCPVAVTVEIALHGEASIFVDFPPGGGRALLEMQASDILVTATAAGAVWIEEVQSASLHEDT